jgi:transcriptional regulator with XRE-family HTH domain
MAKKKSSKSDVRKINRFVQSLCGLYSRVARKLGVDRSYVSRVAKGERQSEVIEQALTAEFDHLRENEV